MSLSAVKALLSPGYVVKWKEQGQNSKSVCCVLSIWVHPDTCRYFVILFWKGRISLKANNSVYLWGEGWYRDGGETSLDVLHCLDLTLEPGK